MSVEIREVAKEMSNKYKDSELSWVLALKRLEIQGYGLYKMPNIQTKNEDYKDNLLNAANWERN